MIILIRNLTAIGWLNVQLVLIILHLSVTNAPHSFIIIIIPAGKRPLGRPRLRQEDNIRLDLEEIGINAGNWVDSAQDRDYWIALVIVVLKLRVP